MSPEISIVLLGNNPPLMEFVAERLRREPEFAILGIADSPGRAVELTAASEEVDLAVIDLDVMNGCCASIVQKLRTLRPGCRIVLLSCSSGEAQLASTLRMRADALVLKSELVDTLEPAIREAMAGGVWLPESARGMVVVNPAGPSFGESLGTSLP